MEIVNDSRAGGESTATVAEPIMAVPKESMPPIPYASILQDHPDSTHKKRLYWDRSHYESPAAQMEALKQSTCLYVGNLNFTTRKRQLYSHFQTLGLVKNIILGLDRLKKTPCGFCFVEFAARPHALQAVKYLSGTKLDGKIIRVELDAGFQQGRQYGRGVHGGQVRDDRRHAGAKRSRESQQTPRVSLDGALPSSRQEKASYYGDNKDGNIKQEAPSDEAAPSQEEPDESTDEPSAKRVKLE